MISGTIVGVESDAVIVAAPFLGKVRVLRKGIAEIEPPILSRLVLKSGEVIEGAIEGLSEESVTIRSGAGVRRVGTAETWKVSVRGREKSLWSGSLAAGLAMADGNSDTLGYNLRGALLRETYWSEFRLKGRYLFERADGAAETDRADGEVRLAYFHRRPWFYFLRQRVEADRIADVDVALESNPGLGLRVLDAGDARLDLELGPGYQFTRFENGDREESVTARAGSLLRLTLFANVRLEIEGEYVQALKDADDFIARAEATLKFPLREGLALGLSLQDRYDNTPAPGRKRNDLSLLTNVELAF